MTPSPSTLCINERGPDAIFSVLTIFPFYPSIFELKTRLVHCQDGVGQRGTLLGGKNDCSNDERREGKMVSKHMCVSLPVLSNRLQSIQSNRTL